LRGHTDLDATDAYERACQYHELYPAPTCAKLGFKYLAHELDEPAPGRGMALWTLACFRLVKDSPMFPVDRASQCQVRSED